MDRKYTWFYLNIKFGINNEKLIYQGNPKGQEVSSDTMTKKNWASNKICHPSTNDSSEMEQLMEDAHNRTRFRFPWPHRKSGRNALETYDVRIRYI